MNVVFFGAPGAGKGTQSALLARRKGLKHISTGELLRQALDEQTAVGIHIRSYMDRGSLVPDDLVIQMVNDALEGLGEGQGFVLDGFPRKVSQAEALSHQLAKMGLALDKSILLEVPRRVLIRRLLGRRVCQGCGVNYHIESHLPQKEGICDDCGDVVAQRPDDNEKAIEKRLEVYEESVKPLRGYFQKVNRFVIVDGMGDTEDVFTRILNVLE